MAKSNQRNRNKTLQLKKPMGQSLLLAILLILIIVLVFEMLSQTNFISQNLRDPFMGFGHNQLNVKINRLEKMFEEKGSIDCIFLGASNIDNAIDPEIFGQVFFNRTGIKINCFNLGCQGFSVLPMQTIQKYVIKKYRPGLVIVGLSPVMLSGGVNPKILNMARTNPWFQYQNGSFNIEGWLIEHSLAYRYFLRFKLWLGNSRKKNILKKWERRINASGFAIPRKRYSLLHMARQDAKIKKSLLTPPINTELDKLFDQLLVYDSDSTIVILEIPIEPNYLNKVRRGGYWDEYNIYIKNKILKEGILYIPTSHFNICRSQDYADHIHMNYSGTKRFSRRMARLIGDVALQGDIKLRAKPDINLVGYLK